MREGIGGTWLVTIVIAVILIFAGYLAISVNYSKAFNVKNELLKVIENTGTLTDDGLPNDVNQKVLETINQVGYRTMSRCKDDYYGYDKSGQITTGDDALLCVRKVIDKECHESNQNVRSVYYQIQVFYQLDLPVFNDLFKFKVNGDTKILYESCDD